MNRTQQPKRLHTKLGEELTMSCAYDPGIPPALLDQLQDITVSSGGLMYLGSPRARLYLNYKEIRFKWYPSGFKPSDMVEGESEAAVEVRIVE